MCLFSSFIQFSRISNNFYKILSQQFLHLMHQKQHPQENHKLYEQKKVLSAESKTQLKNIIEFCDMERSLTKDKTRSMLRTLAICLLSTSEDDNGSALTEMVQNFEKGVHHKMCVFGQKVEQNSFFIKRIQENIKEIQQRQKQFQVDFLKQLSRYKIELDQIIEHKSQKIKSEVSEIKDQLSQARINFKILFKKIDDIKNYTRQQMERESMLQRIQELQTSMRAVQKLNAQLQGQYQRQKKNDSISSESSISKIQKALKYFQKSDGKVFGKPNVASSAKKNAKRKGGNKCSQQWLG